MGMSSQDWHVRAPQSSVLSYVKLIVAVTLLFSSFSCVHPVFTSYSRSSVHAVHSFSLPKWQRSDLRKRMMNKAMPGEKVYLGSRYNQTKAQVGSEEGEDLDK